MKRLMLLVTLFLSACAPSAQALQTAVAQTQAAVPSPLPTKTPISSSTPTIVPIFTPVPATPTIPPTATISPATQTAAYNNVVSTVRASYITATAAILAQKATARVEYATQLAAYQPINLKELLNYPNSHKDEKVTVRGRVFNINNDVVQIYVNGYDAVYIQMSSPVSGIYKDDTITVYGTVYGSYCFTNTLGNQVCQPGLFDAFYVK